MSSNEERDVTLPSGVSIVKRGEEVTYLVPPQWSFDVWMAIVLLPFFAWFGWTKLDDADDAFELFFVRVWIAVVVSGWVFSLDLLSRRHRLVANVRTVALRSVGLLGVRTHECPRTEFRVGDFTARGLYGGRRKNFRWGHLDLFFGGRRVRTMRGWNDQIRDTIADWRRLETPRDKLTTPRAGSRLRVVTEGREYALEVLRPVGSQILWAGTLFPITFAAVVGFNVPWRTVDLTFGAMLGVPGLVLLIVFLLSLNLLTARSRIGVTPKYVVMTTRSALGSSSHTCARADFTIGGVEAVVVGAALRLHFGAESVLALMGSVAADVREAAEFLEAWLTEGAK